MLPIEKYFHYFQKSQNILCSLEILYNRIIGTNFFKNITYLQSFVTPLHTTRYSTPKESPTSISIVDLAMAQLRRAWIRVGSRGFNSYHGPLWNFIFPDVISKLAQVRFGGSFLLPPDLTQISGKLLIGTFQISTKKSSAALSRNCPSPLKPG